MSKTAWLNLRYTTGSRADAFRLGLKKHGYSVKHGLPPKISEGDLFVTWNRIGVANKVAKTCSSAGANVLVAENAAWGNSFCSEEWYTIARDFHNTSGCFDYHGPDRWDDLGFPLCDFRADGETVILPQRGIGSPPTAMPKGWPALAFRENGGRVRKHPGKGPSTPIEDDLKKCGLVVTWGSGAAIKALMMGIKVKSYMPNWIGEQDNTDQGRLDMLRNLAWAQWKHEEIESGFAFDMLINEGA